MCYDLICIAPIQFMFIIVENYYNKRKTYYDVSLEYLFSETGYIYIYIYMNNTNVSFVCVINKNNIQYILIQIFAYSFVFLIFNLSKL